MESDNADSLKSPSLTEVKKCLQEAGSLDSSMTDNEMLEMYEVLNQSKTTASKEDERRRILNKADLNCSIEEAKDPAPILTDVLEYSTKKYSSSDDSFSDEIDLEISILKDKQKNKLKKSPTKFTASARSKYDEEFIDVFNSVPTSHKPLPRISHSPKYNPPYYCCSKLNRINVQQKAQAIFKYHLTLLKTYEDCQRHLQNYASWGKPIQSTLHFNGSLLRKNNSPIVNSPEPEKVLPLQENSEIYILQSGRQTKRKLYTESLDDNEFKKSKSSTSHSPHTESYKRELRMGSNNKTHSERLFDKLVENEKKQKQLDKELEKFNETLGELSDDDDFHKPFEDVAEIVHSEESVIRRKSTPASQERKHDAKRFCAGNSSSDRGPSKNNNKSFQDITTREVSKEKYDPLDTSTLVTSTTSIKKGTCPVCNCLFPLRELEIHAAECEDSYADRGSYRKSPNSSSTHITCENCNLELPFDMEYEVHVRKCLSQNFNSTI